MISAPSERRRSARYVVLVVTIAMFLNVFMLQPVIPVEVSHAGGSRALMGDVTSIFSFATVVFELVTGALSVRIPVARLLAVALLVMGISTAAYLVVPRSVPGLLALTAVRGATFGVGTVSTSYLAATYASPGGRGRALGVYGIAVSLPGVFGASLALAIESSIGAWVDYVLTAAVCFVMTAVLAVSLRRGSHGAAAHRLRWGAVPVMIPIVVSMALMTMTWAGLLAFGPSLLLRNGRAAAPLFFLAVGLARGIARALAGVVADAIGALPVVVASAMALLAGAATFGGFAGILPMLIGAALYGSGLGAASNAVFVAMLERSDERDHGLVSAAWNIAFDGGATVGGIVLGTVAASHGLDALNAWLPALGAAALVVAVVDSVLRRRGPMRGKAVGAPT